MCFCRNKRFEKTTHPPIRGASSTGTRQDLRLHHGRATSSPRDQTGIFGRGRALFSMWRVQYTRIATLHESRRPSSKDAKDNRNFDGRRRLACATREFYRRGPDVNCALQLGLMRVVAACVAAKALKNGVAMALHPLWEHNSFLRNSKYGVPANLDDRIRCHQKVSLVSMNHQSKRGINYKIPRGPCYCFCPLRDEFNALLQHEGKRPNLLASRAGERSVCLKSVLQPCVNLAQTQSIVSADVPTRTVGSQ